MASSPSLLSFSITFLLFLLTWFPYKTLPQNPGNSPSGCGTSLLPLVPCAPFVQGSVPSPAQQCCDNLKQFYNQQPNCLCFLLNNTAFRSFPINRTLALQLPLLCNLQVDISACSGVTLPPTAPSSQVSFGTKTNSTVAASPMVTVAPRPNIMGFGFHHSASKKLKDGGNLRVAVVAAAAVMAFLSTSVLL